MAQDFRIELGVVTNLKPAEKQVQDFIKKQGNKEFTLTPKISTKGINEFRDQFKGIQTEVKLAQAELDKFTQYNEKIATSKINDSLRDMAKVLGNIKAPVKETSTSFDKWIDSQGRLITQTRKFDNELGTVITKVEQYKNQLGQTVTETTTFNDSWEKLSHNMDVVDDKVARAAEEEKKLAEAERLSKEEAEQNAVATNKMGEATQNVTHHAMTLGEKIVDATGKVMLFRMATIPVQAFTQAIDEAKEAIMDFDMALTEFKKVSDLNGESLSAYVDKLGELGESVARTRTEMLDAATNFKKSGFTDEQSAQLAQIASLYQNVADSQLSAGDASAYIISQMKAFGMTTSQEAESIIDKTNEVANTYAVSSTDISQALTKTSSAMAAYGNSIDETISLTTAGAEILNGNVGKVAKGLRSIGANITNLAQASDTMQISVNGSLETIKLIDEETGDMLSTYDVLSQISKYWDEMNSSERSTLALTLANKTQFEVFTSVLGNFETAENALTTSLNSQGSAWKENEAFMESNEASLNSIKASLQELLFSTPIDEFIKGLLRLTATILDLANTGFVKWIAVTALAYKGISTLVEISPVLINMLDLAKFSILKMGEAEVIATLQTEGLGAALAALELNPAVLALTALVAVLGAVAIANERAQKRFEALDTEIENLKSESEQASKTIEELTQKLNELNKQKLEVTDSEQLKQLEEQSAELENQLRLQRELIEANKEKVKADYEAKLSSGRNEYTRYSPKQAPLYQYQTTGRLNEGSSSLPTENDFGKINEISMSGSYDKMLKDQSADVEYLSDRIASLIEKKKELGVTDEEYQNYIQNNTGLTKEEATAYEDYNNKITETSSKLKEVRGDYANTVEYMKSAEEAGVKLSESSKEIIDGYDEQIAKSEDRTMSLEELAEYYGVGVDEITAYVEASEEEITNSEAAAQIAAERAEKANEENTALQDLSSTLATISTDYQSLKTAVDEYNSGGTMSLETLDALINAATNYSGCLELQNGKLVLSEQYFENLAQQKIANAKADLVAETQTRLTNLAIDEQSKSVKNTASTIDTSKSSVDNICTALQNMAGDAITAAQAWNALKTEMDDSKKGIDYSKQVDKVRDEFTAQWKTLDNIGKQISGNFSNYSAKAAKSASGSHKFAAKESKDAWLEAYKAEKDALESLYKTNVITAEEYATKLRELSDKYLTDTADHQKKYAKEIHDAYEAMYTALKKSAKEALDEEEKRLKKVYDDTKDQKSKALKDLKKLHEEEEKAIKREIDALKKEKDAIKDGYDARIKALKSEREEYERQVKLMQLKEKLAKAKTTKQYVMNELGRFTYQEDSEAVDQAREDLIEEESKQAYERELNALEQARDNAIAIYEQRIQALEDHYDAVKERNDRAEEQLEAHYDAMLEQYERNYNDFKENADKYLNGQMQLVNAENTEWGRRLTNLANFVNEYNRLMNSLNSGSTNNSNNYSGASSKGASVSSSSSKSKSSKGSSSSSYKGVKSIGTATVKGKTIVKPHYSGKGSYSSKKRASGDASIASDGVYLVGDSPNQELIIGSKLNGVPLTLSRGDGVVNAKSTRSLAGILNMISGLAKPLPPNQTTNNSTSNVTISNVSLPNVKNGEEFIDYLQHFDIDMMQRSYDNF